jgi:hypothetical protein
MAASAAMGAMLPKRLRKRRRMTALKRVFSALRIGAFSRPQLQFGIVTNPLPVLIRRSESANAIRL